MGSQRVILLLYATALLCAAHAAATVLPSTIRVALPGTPNPPFSNASASNADAFNLGLARAVFATIAEVLNVSAPVLVPSFYVPTTDADAGAALLAQNATDVVLMRSVVTLNSSNVPDAVLSPIGVATRLVLVSHISYGVSSWFGSGWSAITSVFTWTSVYYVLWIIGMSAATLLLIEVITGSRRFGALVCPSNLDDTVAGTSHHAFKEEHLRSWKTRCAEGWRITADVVVIVLGPFISGILPVAVSKRVDTRVARCYVTFEFMLIVLLYAVILGVVVVKVRDASTSTAVPTLSFAAQQNATIGVVASSFGDEYVSQRLLKQAAPAHVDVADITLVRFADIVTALDAFASGTIDAILTDEMWGHMIAQHAGPQCDVGFTADRWGADYMTFAVNNASVADPQALARAIGAALSAVQLDGTLDALMLTAFGITQTYAGFADGVGVMGTAIGTCTEYAMSWHSEGSRTTRASTSLPADAVYSIAILSAILAAFFVTVALVVRLIMIGAWCCKRCACCASKPAAADAGDPKSVDLQTLIPANGTALGARGARRKQQRPQGRIAV